MAVDPLILVCNPGSASRKYGLFKGKTQIAELHFETTDSHIVASIFANNKKESTQLEAINFDDALLAGLELLLEKKILSAISDIDLLAIRIVAPSAKFLENRVIDEIALQELNNLSVTAPLHIKTTINEINNLKVIFNDKKIIGISDSSFHAQKPDYAWNYAIDLQTADALDIKKFGYHGISAQSVIKQVADFDILPEKIIICHLGSGCSVTAVLNGVSIDNTMGYSPLSGVMMSTRSGDIDPIAIKQLLQNDDFEKVLQNLNSNSGLLGISGKSSDIRDLLKLEQQGDYRSALAINMFVYSIVKAVGQMASVLNGAEMLVFTGTIGQRSAVIRQRILEKLDYLGFAADSIRNPKHIDPVIVKVISPRTRVNTVAVVPTNESQEIAIQALRFG